MIAELAILRAPTNNKNQKTAIFDLIKKTTFHTWETTIDLKKIILQKNKLSYPTEQHLVHGLVYFFLQKWPIFDTNKDFPVKNT